MKYFNEGKACDAVIRHIEFREGCSRRDLRFPEKENDSAPVELICFIGDCKFAFEHTGIEPFERLTELKAKSHIHFKPIKDSLVGRLPKTEHFVLHVPAKATLELKGKNLVDVQDAIVAWIENVAPTLPIARFDNYVIDTSYLSIPNVPFDVALHRVQMGGEHGQISFKHYVDRNLEGRQGQRTNRIRRAYREKIRKLANWQKDGARSVLILEENDINLTIPMLVADALTLVEQDEGTIEKPNEIYLLSSGLDKNWFLWPLRIDDHVYTEFSKNCDSIIRIDPITLEDVTNR